MSDKEIEELKSKNINAYTLLEIPLNSSDNDIKKSYRKKALIYHPDKNSSSDAIEKFHLIKLALNILLDKTYRVKYDNWLKSVEIQLNRTNEISNKRKRMLDELEKSEAKAEQQTESNWNKRRATKSSDSDAIEIERLREEGMSLRKNLQSRRDAQYQSKGSNSDLVSNTTTSKSNPYSVLLRWKFKQGIDLTPEILASIMSLFGTVTSVLPQPSSSSRYLSAIITFSSETAYLKALSYDISREKSRLWEGTSLRKLSSLLREIKPYLLNESMHVDSNDELYENMIYILDKLKDYRR